MAIPPPSGVRLASSGVIQQLTVTAASSAYTPPRTPYVTKCVRWAGSRRPLKATV
jgi:hypothetical protein